MLESYITPLLTSYLDKYIKNFKPSDLQLSFWGGAAVLRNLELNLEAIEDLLRDIVPFKLKSGSVKQLIIQIPWTSIGSESIEITFDTVECTIELADLHNSSSTQPSSHIQLSASNHGGPSDHSQAAPSYIKGLLNRITDNVIVKATNLLLKIKEDSSDMLMALSFKEINGFMANDRWDKEFIYTDYYQQDYSLYRVCLVTGATVCLDSIGGSGQVEAYNDPFVSPCNFQCRWKANYANNIIIENGFEFLFDDVFFSVTEQQFVLFLHFVDWLLAMYYSLKGKRKDSEMEERMARDSSVKEDSLSPSNFDNDGTSWLPGWVASFISDDVVNNSLTTPTSPPTLSLGFYTKRVTINFKVTQREVFFSNIKNIFHDIMKVEFLGCIARVDQRPSSGYLGVSVGVMSVDAWVGGACTCKLVSMATKARSSDDGKDVQLVHIYELGCDCDDVKLELLLIDSFYIGTGSHSNTAGGPHSDTAGPHSNTAGGPHSDTHSDTAGSTAGPHSDTAGPHSDTHSDTAGPHFDTHSDTTGPHSDTAGPHSDTHSDTARSHSHTHSDTVGSQSHTHSHTAGSHSHTNSDPIASNWLQYRPEYAAVWFSYNYEDVFDKQETETCSQTLTMGQQVISLTSEVIHSLQFFIKRFLTSLDATPLASQNMLVVGDPQAKTNINITSDRIQICLPANSHLFNGYNQLVPSHDHSSPGVLFYIDEVTVKISLPMYSGNVTPQQPQQVLMEALCKGLHVMMCDWFALTGKTANNKSISNVSILKLNIHTSSTCITEGTSVITSQYYQLDVPNDNTISINVHQLSAVTCIMSSWLLEDTANVSLPSLSNGSGNIHATLTACNVEVLLSSSEQTISASLDQLAIYGDAFVFESPSSINSYTKVERLKDTQISHKEEMTTERAFELCVILPADTSYSASIRLITGKSSVFISHSFIDNYISDVARIFRYYLSYTANGNNTTTIVINPKASHDPFVTENVNKQEKINTFLSSSSINVLVEHVLLVYSSSISPSIISDTFPLPIDSISHALTDINQSLLVWVFPQWTIDSTHSTIGGNLSWNITSEDFALYTVVRGGASYMLHPLSFEVSIAPIHSPDGFGIHINTDVLQLTIAIEQIRLLRKCIYNMQDLLSSFLMTEDSNNDDGSTRRGSSPPPHPSSPHLSLSHHTSSSRDSATPTSSGSFRLLWFQLTLDKFLISLLSSHLDDVLYTAQMDELSLSYDSQGRSSKYQLKVLSLEVKELNGDLLNDGLFSKLFSSQTSVICNETATKDVKACLRTTCTANDVPKVILPSSTSSFINIEIVTYSDEHKATDLSIQVRCFEGVVYIPLLMDTISILHCLKPANDELKETCSSHVVIWPNMDVKFCSFQLYMSYKTSTLVINNNGLTITSNLDYHVPRMTIHSPAGVAAARRLNVAISEKRVPPLPGYELMCYSLQAVGLCHIKDGKFRTSCISQPTNITALYSPALYWPSNKIPGGSLVSVTGHLLEVHLTSELFLLCGHDQMHCLVQMVEGVITVLRSLPQNKEQSSSINIQFLLTGKAMHFNMFNEVTSPSAMHQEWSYTRLYEGIHISCFNPVFMISTTQLNTAVDLSIFNLVANYRKEGWKHCCHILETMQGCIDVQTGLPCGLFSLKYHSDSNEGYNISINMSRSVRLTISAPLLCLAFDIFNDFYQPLGMLYSLIRTRSMLERNNGELLKEDDNRTKFNCFIMTKQFVLRVSSSSYIERDQFMESNEHILLSWQCLHVNTPSSTDRNNANDGCMDVEGLKLSMLHDKLVDIVPYTLLHCSIRYCSSKYVRSKVLMSISSGDFKVTLSCNVIQLILNLTEEFLKILRDCDELMALLVGRCYSNDELEMKTNRIHSKDDIRSGTLSLNTEDMETLRLPKPGEVIFYNGNIEDHQPPHMSWCYTEPRYIDSLKVLPVPLGDTVVQDDYPIDIKVNCELAFYSDGGWSAIGNVHISETAAGAMAISDHEPASVWRVTMTSLEWLDEDDNYIHIISLPLIVESSNSLSPLMLAGCCHLDSFIVLSSISFLSLDLNVKNLNLTFKKDTFNVNYGKFNGFQIQNDDAADQEIDLFQISINNLSCNINLYPDTDCIIKMTSLISVMMLSLIDLTWNTVIYPIQFHLCLTKHTINHQSGLSGRNEISVTLSIDSPCLIRVNPSVVYTVAMATRMILQHLSQSDENERCYLISPYVICNSTRKQFTIGQVNTPELVTLPADSCIGYTWNTLKSTRELHIGLLFDNDTVSWSDPFTIDTEGLQEVSLDERNVVIDIVCNGSVKKITIRGNITITSRISTPLFITFPLTNHEDVCYTLPPAGQLKGLLSPGKNWTNMTVSLSPSGPHDQAPCVPLVPTSNLHQLLKIPNANEEITYSWLSIENTKLPYDIKITFAPLIEVCNWFPYSLWVFLEGNTAIELSGKGHFCLLSHLSTSLEEYTLQFGFHPSSQEKSEPIKLSLEQLTVDDTAKCTGRWPFKRCLKEHNDVLYEKSTIPTGGEGSVDIVIMMTRSQDGTIKLTISPRLLLMNELMASVTLGCKDGRMETLHHADVTIACFNESMTLRMDYDDSQLCNEFNLKEVSSQTNTRLALSSPNHPEKVCILQLNHTLHCCCTVVAMQPLYVIVNSTPHGISVLPCLHDGRITTNRDDSVKLTLSVDGSKPLLVWNKMGIDSLTFVVYITTASNGQWSIPLSLNYNRRSFSLPVPSSSSSPCVLTTHKHGGHHWVVISSDSNPRLLITNYTSCALHIREADVVDIQSCPQILPSGSETVFDPPSLAALYPLIQQEDAKDRGIFKTLSDIKVQLQEATDQSTWSKPISLLYDIEQFISDIGIKVLLATSYHNGCVYISLLPANDQPVPITDESMMMTCSSSTNMFTAKCLMKQIVCSIDTGKEHHIHDTQPVIRLIFDSVNVSLKQWMGCIQANIDIQSIQVDNATAASSAAVYDVIAIPRFNHNPPLSIIETDVQHFLSVSVNWVYSRGQVYPEINITCQPVTLQVDDVFIQRLTHLFKSYRLPVEPHHLTCHHEDEIIEGNTVPAFVMEEAKQDREGLTISIFTINPIMMYVSINITQTISISCDDCQISLSPINLTNVYSNWMELSQILSVHYTSSALMQAGWIIGSLDLLGNPASLINSIYSGVRDFIHLPYEGLTRGPGYFILGLGYGVSSLAASVIGGTISSLTNFTASIGTNMEILSLDSEHVKYQEMLRHNGSSGLVTGVSGLGMSLMSAAAGLVEQPMQSVQQSQGVSAVGYTKDALVGLGKGLLGVVTKPVGGVCQLVSQTGYGIVDKVGWRHRPKLKETSLVHADGLINNTSQIPSIDRCIRSLHQLLSISSGEVIYAVQGSCGSPYKGNIVFITSRCSLIVLDVDENVIIRNIKLAEYDCLVEKCPEQLTDSKFILIFKTATYLKDHYEKVRNLNHNHCIIIINEFFIDTFVSVIQYAKRCSLNPQEFFVCV